MRILRAADTKSIQKKIRDFLLDRRILDKSKELVRGNRAFVAFLENRLNPLFFYEFADELCDCLLYTSDAADE